MHKYIIPALIIFFLAQLYFISTPIISNEDLLKNGTPYKFRIAPVDPEDPFRGRYVTLSFRDNQVDVPLSEEWQYDEIVFAEVTNGQDGYARIKKLHRSRPSTSSYIKTSVSQVSIFDNHKKIFLDLPFDRYYTEESKAPELEKRYQEAAMDTTRTAYIIVHVKKGDAVIKDLVLN